MLDGVRTAVARLRDALEIWDGSPRPWKGFSWLKVKASICIALGLERRDWSAVYHEFVPVWWSAASSYYSYDGPGQHWWEVAVDPHPFRWAYTRYENGF